MLNVEKILVPTDHAPSAQGAFQWARDLALRRDAEIHVLAVLPHGSDDPLFSFFHDLLDTPGTVEQAQEKLLQRVEQEIRAELGEHPHVKHVCREGSPVAQEILAYARDEDVDLIAMGTHGHRSLEHALGGTAGEVVRLADCPVITVRHAGDDREAPPSVRRILVPVDFSEIARPAIRTARALGACYDAALLLLFVAEERLVPLFSDTGIPSFTTLRLDPDTVAHADGSLRRLYEAAGGPDVEAAFLVRSGHPAREVLDVARSQGVDLIVMGRHGQTEVERFTLGSVAEKVVRRASCPVLTFQAAGKQLVG